MSIEVKLPLSGPVTFDAAAHQAAREVAALVIRKQRDYGPRNILRAPGSPAYGILVRLSDKLARLDNLLKQGRLTDQL